MPTLALPINRIEDTLEARGYETRYTGSEDYTSYTIISASKELEFLDAVSGSLFKPDHLTEAVIYGAVPEDVTHKFDNVESVEEFLAAVAEVLA